MDGIESAIRNALAKGDAGDRAFRERVYRSVFAALERKMAEPPGLAAEEAQRRRESLKQRIVVIEREFALSTPPPTPTVTAAAQQAPTVEAPSRASGTSPAAPRVESHARREPTLDAPAVQGPTSEPRMAPVQGDRDVFAVRPSRDVPTGGFSLPGVSGDLPENAVDEVAEERRRPWGLLLIAVTLLAIVGIGAWWAVETGFFGRDDGSVPNPPVTLEEEEFAPPPLSQEGAADREWTNVFSADDPTGFTPLAGASAEALKDDGEDGARFLRLRSSNDAAAIAFAVDRDALAGVAGGRAVFNLVARAQEGQETQISVSCDFGALGDCGRRRYVVGLHRADFLFEVDMPAGAPAGDGAISIVTDVDGGGKAIDLFEIRLAPTE